MSYEVVYSSRPYGGVFPGMVGLGATSAEKKATAAAEKEANAAWTAYAREITILDKNLRKGVVPPDTPDPTPPPMDGRPALMERARKLLAKLPEARAIAANVAAANAARADVAAYSRGLLPGAAALTTGLPAAIPADTAAAINNINAAAASSGVVPQRITDTVRSMMPSSSSPSPDAAPAPFLQRKSTIVGGVVVVAALVGLLVFLRRKK